MHFDLWTFALQAINAGVLIWLLAWFLFRPIRAMIDQRRQAAETLLADAAAARAKAEADAAEIARQRQAFAATGEQILAEAHKQAADDVAAKRAQAEQAIARMQQEAAAELAHERSAMRGALEVEASGLAVTIARRLLARVPESAVTNALLHDLADRLAGLPKDERARLAEGAIEIVTAGALGAEQQAACAALLGQVLTGRWPSGLQGAQEVQQGAQGVQETQADPSIAIRFLADPSLLAGVELRAPHTLIRNHWRADLERIARELVVPSTVVGERQRPLIVMAGPRVKRPGAGSSPPSTTCGAGAGKGVDGETSPAMTMLDGHRSGDAATRPQPEVPTAQQSPTVAAPPSPGVRPLPGAPPPPETPAGAVPRTETREQAFSPEER